jgi:copper homeostasis protein (lipoprotein)
MQKSRITAIALVLAGTLGPSGFATRAAASSVAQSVVPLPMPLEGTFWQAVAIDDRQISLFGVPGPYLVFERTGRFVASDGCNRLAGDFDVKEDVVRFERIESTHMACVAVHDIQRMFDRALTDARRLVLVGNQLELLDANNSPLVIFRSTL